MTGSPRSPRPIPLCDSMSGDPAVALRSWLDIANKFRMAGDSLIADRVIELIIRLYTSEKEVSDAR